MLKIAFDPIYKHQLKIGHRFPMEKYELLPEHLLRNNICNSDNFFSPLPIEKELLLDGQERPLLREDERTELELPQDPLIYLHGSYSANPSVQMNQDINNMNMLCLINQRCSI